jgi:hypothetical protein
MHVEDPSGAFEVADAGALEAALKKRYENDATEMWLYPSDDARPALGIFASGHLADVHYLPSEEHPGFRALGGEGLDRAGTTTFYMGSEPQIVPNRFVVPFSNALDAAREFLRTGERPGCLEWLEL